MDYSCNLFQRLELRAASELDYPYPFAGVSAFADFYGPDGSRITLNAYYDGDNTWVVRFVPHLAGRWHYQWRSFPVDTGLCASGEILAGDGCGRKERGFLRAYPGEGWGLRFDNGEDLLIIGDTMYNLFGAAYCGVEIREILQKRKEQGHNLIRIKFNPTPYQPGFQYAPWYNGQAFPWAGSPEMPDYSAFNLSYFRSADSVFELFEELGLGIELIVMPFSYELPMTDRQHFLPEHQELYINYIVARYAAYRSLYLWNTANEYNQYVLARMAFGNDRLDELICAKYAERIAGLIRRADGYRHPVGVHDTMSGSDVVKPLKERFTPWSGIDVLLFQSWGDMDSQRGRELCSGLEQAIRKHAAGKERVYILAEYGYEASQDAEHQPDFANGFGPGHTRRGAWRALMSGAHVICGYENTSVTVIDREHDVPGIQNIIYLKRFFNEVVDFSIYRPFAEDRLLCDWEEEKPEGERALCMSAMDASSLLVYLPAGGRVGVRQAGLTAAGAYWYDPMRGTLAKTEPDERTASWLKFIAPEGSGAPEGSDALGGSDETGNSKDWVLLLK